jgi:nucleoside-diphosphate-sugar epimerase
MSLILKMLNKKIKIIVTGGCGFLGSHLVDKLIHEKFLVFVIDNLSTGSLKNLNSKAKFFFSDIEDENQLENIFKQVKPHFVFHLAAKINTSIKEESPTNDVNNQIIGSLNLMKLSVQYNVEKFFYGSSVAVYGKQSIFPVKEDAIKLPDTSYGICKLFTEKYLEYYCKFYKLKYMSLRYSNIYGDRQKIVGEVGVVAIFLNNLLKKKKLNIFGNGKLTRDFISVYDSVELTYRCLHSKYIGPINIASGEEITTNKITIELKKYFSDLKYIYKKSRINEIKRFKCDIKRMTKVLGGLKQNFNKSLKKTIIKTINT